MDVLKTSVHIRDALIEDAVAIARIYNQAIEDRVATLETELRTPDERRQWLANRTPRHPVVVATEGSSVVGWASLNSFNPRPVYDHVADFSVYVDRDRRGTGVGTALLAALELRAGEIGYHKLVLAALPWNSAGMALYRRCGFRTVGVYFEQGWLDGRWVDAVLMEKILA
jgi:phosphinothricin acetyltransferase